MVAFLAVLFWQTVIAREALTTRDINSIDAFERGRSIAPTPSEVPCGRSGFRKLAGPRFLLLKKPLILSRLPARWVFASRQAASISRTFGTASATMHGELRALGIDHLIDYRTEDFNAHSPDVGALTNLLGRKREQAAPASSAQVWAEASTTK